VTEVVKQVDAVIVGAGIVGLATAYEILTRAPSTKLVVLEKEHQHSQHQSGRNSGVIHSGIYYAPGSLKASNCRAGRSLMIAFCEAERIPFEICGKVIVATDPLELPGLERLRGRAIQNGVQCELIDASRLRKIEPHVQGIAALWVPEAGIVDYAIVCQRLVEKIRERSGEVWFDHKVEAVAGTAQGMSVQAGNAEIDTQLLVNCAGLHSDRICALAGTPSEVKIVPFRGEYYELAPQARSLVNNLIYPVPDPNFPFLGVHLTRTVHGGIECGPNAVLALGREAYENEKVDLKDTWDTLSYPGFLKLAAKHWRAGSRELVRSLSKAAFAESLQRLVPEISADDLLPAPSGIRAQALRRDGSLVDDFVIQQAPGAVHVCNAPSPAATSAFSIAKHIVTAAGL
jgi:L-2-hydroxyglutarate oxidase